MTLVQLASYVCSKVGRLDDYTLGVAQGFVKARHRQLYEAFDWKSAQIITSVSLSAAPTAPIPVTGVDHIISVRYDNRFLDPVLPQFIFDTHPEMLDQTGPPQFYNEQYDQTLQSRSIQLYPAPGTSEIGTGVVINVLGKAPFNTTATTVLVPYAEQALIAFVTADLLEFLHQAGKAQAKLQEAQALLETAKTNDTPPATRPRQGKVLTASGNSLSELTDSVCDIIGKWEPQTRISVQERIRRNYQTLWEMSLWPESTIVARVTCTDNEQIILPHYFDRVVSVRPDPLTTGTSCIVELLNRDVSLFFNIDPQIFERLGDPIYYSTIGPVGVSVLPPYNEQLTFVLQGPGSSGRLTRNPPPSETISVFVKGWSNGAEIAETVDVKSLSASPGPVPFPGPSPSPILGVDTTSVSVFPYDIPITIAKPVSTGTLFVSGTSSGRLLLTLNPGERERKHIRIWLQPNRSGSPTMNSDTKQTFLVLGKKQISPLLDDADTCELRNVENILINGAAADMARKLGNTDLANDLKSKAGASIQILQDGENQQATHNMVITPYAEPEPLCIY